MAKHCTNCGHELRDADKFCAECGTPVDGGAPQSQPMQWEYCEIVAKKIRDRLGFKMIFTQWFAACCFEAEGVGVNGIFSAGKSPVFEVETDEPTDWYSRYIENHDQNVLNALNDLIRQLTQAGWETLPTKGNNWYSYKFRRPVQG